MGNVYTMQAAKDVTINIRATARQRDMIDRAAEAAGKSRSDFMLEISCRAAEQTLLDQRFFAVDDEAWRRLNQMLDAPALPNERLRKLLRAKSPWER